MNKGTKERTAARILASIGTVLAVWKVVFEFVLAEVGEMWVAVLVATIVACAVIAVDAVTTYFNNDYSEEACIGTGVTRQLKAEKGEGYVGDFFYTDEAEETAEYTAEEEEKEEEEGDDEQ